MSVTSRKIIYYYQTFSSLIPLVHEKLENVVVYVSSIHFGKNSVNSKPYIHLNNQTPDIFPDLWLETELASCSGIKIMTMLGGAAGAYDELFSDFNTN